MKLQPQNIEKLKENMNIANIYRSYFSDKIDRSFWKNWWFKLICYCWCLVCTVICGVSGWEMWGIIGVIIFITNLIPLMQFIDLLIQNFQNEYKVWTNICFSYKAILNNFEFGVKDDFLFEKFQETCRLYEIARSNSQKIL